MDEYSDGRRPPSANYKKDPRGLVNAKPEFGGHKRPGYPRGISQNTENEDTSEYEKIHGRIPGEAVLMDDGGDSHEGLGDRFTARGEGNEDSDVLPLSGISKDLDKGPVGPHSMQGNVFNRIKKKTKLKGLKL